MPSRSHLFGNEKHDKDGPVGVKVCGCEGGIIVSQDGGLCKLPGLLIHTYPTNSKQPNR